RDAVLLRPAPVGPIHRIDLDGTYFVGARLISRRRVGGTGQRDETQQTPSATDRKEDNPFHAGLIWEGEPKMGASAGGRQPFYDKLWLQGEQVICPPNGCPEPCFPAVSQTPPARPPRGNSREPSPRSEIRCGHRRPACCRRAPSTKSRPATSGR